MNPYIDSQSLSEFHKWKIYCLYLVRYFQLKHCLIITLNKVNDESSYHKGTLSYRKYEYHPSFRNVDLSKGECLSFLEFISPNNILKVDTGEGWQEQGYAQRSWIDYPINSLAYWFMRHKDFNL